MAKKKGLGQIVTDLERQINDDYNALIQLTVEGLGTEENSPVEPGSLPQAGKHRPKKSALRINAKITLHGQKFMKLVNRAGKLAGAASATNEFIQAKNLWAAR